MIGHHCLSWVRGGGRDYVVVVSGVGSTGAGGTLVDGGCLKAGGCWTVGGGWTIASGWMIGATTTPNMDIWACCKFRINY